MQFSYKIQLTIAAFLILISALILQPNGDDWYYVTQPTLNGLVETFLVPHQGKWRPIDGLTGWFLYYYPNLYPHLNHFLVVGFHVGSTVLLYRLIRTFHNSSSKTAYLFSAAFFIHPNVFSTVFSIDSINQSGTVFWGLLAVYLSTKKNWGYFFLSLVFSWVSVLFKESGFGFILVLSIFSTIKINSTWKDLFYNKKNFIKTTLIGINFLLYSLTTFGIDFFLNFSQRSTSLNENMSPDIYNPFFGFGALIGRFLPVNLPAIMNPEQSIFWFILPFIIGLLWIGYLIFKVIRSNKFKSPLTILLGIFIIGYTLIHASMNGITEMNSYTIIVFIFILLGSILDLQSINKYILFSYIVSASIIWIHKYSILISCDIKTNKLNSQITIAEKRDPKNILAILLDNQSYGHDIYQPYAAISSGGALSMKKLIGYNDLKITQTPIQIFAPTREVVLPGSRIIFNQENWKNQLDSLILNEKPEYDAIWVIAQDSLYGVY